MNIKERLLRLRLAGVFDAPDSTDPDYAVKIAPENPEMNKVEYPLIKKFKQNKENKYVPATIQRNNRKLSGFKDVMPNIPPSRVEGTAPYRDYSPDPMFQTDFGTSQIENSPESELAFKLHDSPYIRGHKPLTEQEADDKLEYLIRGGPFKKQLTPSGNDVDVDVDVDWNIDEHLESPDDVPLRETVSQTEIDKTLPRIFSLLEQEAIAKDEGKFADAQNFRDQAYAKLVKYMPIGDNNPNDILDFIYRRNIEKWSSRGIFDVSRENALKYSKLNNRLQKIAGIDDSALHKAIKKYGRPITYKQQRSISWLSPEGVLYDAEDYSEHSAWLEDMLKKSGDKNLYESYKRKNTGDLDEGDDFAEESDIVKFMEANNYVRVNSVGNELAISTADETTPAQNKVLQDIAISKRLKPENIVLDGNSYDDVSTPGMTEDDYEVQRFRRMGLNKIGKLNNRLQKLAGFGRPPQRVIDAFKSGQPAETKTFKTDGKKLFFGGHEVARHTKGGIEVSYAGHNTSMTSATIRALGVDTRKVKGITTINGKKIDPESTDFYFVPKKNISKGTFVINPNAKPKTNFRQTVDSQEKFRRNVRKEFAGDAKKVPLDPTSIQPEDQKVINEITGIKSNIPRKTLGADTHHIFPKSRLPGLKENTFNGIPLSKANHKEIHDLNKGLFSRTSKLKQRLAERYRAFTNTSSFVGNMRYDQDEQEMTGILSGKHYKWCGVPERTFDAFQGAGSAGAFFNRNVKGQFDCSSGGILTEGQSRISKLKQRVAVIEPLVKKKKKGRIIKKVSPRVAMQNKISKETIRRIKNNKEIPKLGLGEGLTYIADIDRFVDGFNPEDADFLNKRYPGEGKFLAIISTTTNIDNIDALEPYHARLREKGFEALTGFYRNTQTGKLEFDSSYAKRFNSLDEIDPELQVPTEKSPTGQESALVITPDNKAELYFNKKYDAKQVLP